MSKARDFKKELEEVAKRKDISQAEIDFKMRRIYEEQARALKAELAEIDKQVQPYTTRPDAQAKLINATKDYTNKVAQEVNKSTTDAIQSVARQTAEAHVKAGQNALRSAGARPTLQASMIANNEVNATVARTLEQILSGNAYPNPYPLSQRIWTNARATQRDIHTIIMNAMQQGKSIEDISNLITSYVDPSARKDWNKLMQDGYHVHFNNVEYNAQRLARTVSQHTYQKATEDRARDNPFITDFVWLANGSRPCPLCISRDGRVYGKGEAPLDHPNGMCVLEPVIDADMDDRLAAWMQGDDDTDITTYARSLGYEV